MPKYWNGISFDKKTVREGNSEQEIVIAMTEEEAKDSSYREYLMEAETEKTKEWLRNHPKQEPKEGSREALASLLKDISDFNRRKRESPNRKYF